MGLFQSYFMGHILGLFDVAHFRAISCGILLVYLMGNYNFRAIFCYNIWRNRWDRRDFINF